ncbi:Major Facilitator superfamily [Seminavis robusta]|uniref:Major Facilitator superfamily n=1 Tax=Seminavis robusta TaxID=568900 RepID=A0A9N8EHY2_9STRA|nr:Major Facilitator superfamily [Seminavis robusta]|eukprot:Sro1107_g242080.1 Major Facilitator superfamily (556) ;mRNA; r:17702-19572
MAQRRKSILSATSPFRWQAALCYLAFTITFLLSNTVPYAPFMAITLLPNHANAENVGKYSAFFTSCVIWGRSAGAGKWGRMADTRGRLQVLYINLIMSTMFTLAFGLSNNYFVALATRFFLGLFCDIGSITKVCVSELAGKDRELEAKSMNLVVLAWALSSLLSPAIGGVLADPVKQFPDAYILQQDPVVHEFLLQYKYFLPNLVGAILCLIGVPVVKFNLRETLTDQDEDAPTGEEEKTEEDPLIGPGLGESYVLSREAIQIAKAQDDEDALLRDAYVLTDDFEGVMTTAQSRHAIFVSNKSLMHEEEDNNQQESNNGDDDSTNAGRPPSTLGFLCNCNNLSHLIVYCLGLFLIQFNTEAFPLFCLSQTSGLGLDESTIGGIMMASGLIHSLLQPSIYHCVFARRGLKGSIKWAATAAIPMFFLVPFALLSKKVGPDHHLRWMELVYLGVIGGLAKIFTVTFFSSISVSMNRLVPRKQRATFNGLLTKIAGTCKGMAPIMAGFFTAFAFSSRFLPPWWWGRRWWGGVLLYSTMGWMSICLAFLSFLLLGRDEPH